MPVPIHGHHIGKLRRQFFKDGDLTTSRFVNDGRLHAITESSLPGTDNLSHILNHNPI